MKYFTSDFHLGHANIIKFCNRPFSSVEEMDETITDNFLKTVKPGDIVYFLGDLAMNREPALKFLAKIPENVQFHFIYGNHDMKLPEYFKQYCDTVSQYKNIQEKGKDIFLCHYPMYTWPSSHYGSWMCFGHHHWDTRNIFYGKMMNVSVDANNFKLVSFDEVVSFMETRENNWDYIKDRVKS
jgi:calcineurin-like phosphoesterase family protein